MTTAKAKATSIPLTQLPAAKDEIRRDQYGRYLIVPPGGGKPEGYTRVTTVASTLDSGGGLAPWKASMTAAGIIMRRGLRAQWEALLAEHNGDPWYASEEGKAACKKLVEECSAVGGANDRRDMGTSLHTITALVDLGRMPVHLTEETERDIEAYNTGLALACVDLDRSLIETTVVLDDWKIAGTFDRLAMVPGFDLPLVADLKTGAELSYSWQSISVQLAAYAHADAIYVQGRKPDGSEDQRLPMPEVDQNWGLIMWLNAGTATLELHLVDLVQGWAAFEVSMWCRGWRNEKVSIPLADYQPPATDDDGEDLVPLLEASIAVAEATKVEAPAPVTVDYQPGVDFTGRLRFWLQERINVIGRDPSARTDLMACWPAGVPGLRQSMDHSPEDLDAIEKAVDGVANRHAIGLPDARPTTDAVGTLLHLFPHSSLLTEQDNAS